MTADPRYFVMFLVDDVQGNLFCERIMQDKAILPRVKAEIFDRGTHCANTISLFTSASVQGHTTLLTGRYADGHEVLSEGFWDTADPANPQRVAIMSVRLSTLKLWNKRIATKTLYEWVPDSTAFHVVDRGAKERLFKPSAYIRFVWAYLKVVIGGAKFYVQATDFWERLIIGNAKRYLKKLNKKGMTTGVFIAFSPSDNAAHLYGMLDGEGQVTAGYRQSLELLDKTYALMVDGYDEKGTHVKGLKELGLFDKTLFVITADHASRYIREEIRLVEHLRKNVPLTFVPLVNPQGKGAPCPGENAETREQADFLLAEEGGTAAFYFRNPRTAQFDQHLPLTTFENYAPAKTAGQAGSSVNLVDTLLAIPHTDHAYFHVGPREVLVAGQRGRALITASEARPASYKYVVIAGEDPLQYAQDPAIASRLLDGQFHGRDEWLATTARARYPAVPEIVSHFFACRFAGNALVMPEDPYTYYVKPEGFKKVYMHDRDNREETIVPLVFAGPGVKQGHAIPCARNVDVLPTILNWLGVPFQPEDFDGAPLRDIFERE